MVNVAISRTNFLPGWRANYLSLNDEMLLVAIFGFVSYLLFVVIVDRYS